MILSMYDPLNQYRTVVKRLLQGLIVGMSPRGVEG